MTQSATQSAPDAAARTAHRPFGFETEFDAAGVVVSAGAAAARPVKRAYLAAEVEALTAQAGLEAREAALAEIDGVRALALAEIGRAAAEALSTLAAVAQAHRVDAAELAMSAARVMAGGALERFPEAPLKAAVETLAQEIDATPRLVIHALGLDEPARAAVEEACVNAGRAGAVVFRDDAALGPAAFRLEWADGRAEFDPGETAQRVEQAMRAALAAENGHAEALTPPTGADRDGL